MTNFHLNPTTGEPAACRALKGNCPFGTPADHYVSKAAAREAFEASLAVAALPDAVKKASAITWEDSAKANRLRIVEARALQAPGATHSGAHIPNNADGSVQIAKGTYYPLNLDTFGPDYLSEDPKDHEWHAWHDQVSADAVPHGIRAAYYDGEPAYYLPIEDSDVEGEIVVNEATFKKMLKKGYYRPAYAPELPRAEVLQDTHLFGDYGDFSKLPENFFTPEDELSDEQTATRDQAELELSHARFSIRDHPHIDYKSGRTSGWTVPKAWQS